MRDPNYSGSTPPALQKTFEFFQSDYCYRCLAIEFEEKKNVFDIKPRVKLRVYKKPRYCLSDEQLSISLNLAVGER